MCSPHRCNRHRGRHRHRHGHRRRRHQHRRRRRQRNRRRRHRRPRRLLPVRSLQFIVQHLNSCAIMFVHVMSLFSSSLLLIAIPF